MIALKKEMQIKTLLKAGFTDLEVSKTTAITQCVVANVRKMMYIVESTSEHTIQTVCEMLLAKMSVRAIENATKIPHDTIVAIRRYNYLQLRESGDHKPMDCPTCNATILPKCTKLNTLRGNKLPEAVLLAVGDCGCYDFETLRVYMAELYRIVYDLTDAASTTTITNPIVRSLAADAHEVVCKVNNLAKVL